MSKPAARIGDMHSCPMVNPGTPPIPHVGGPVTGPGVPTVLIGGQPAAVVGDTCTCVGPPDSIIMGSSGVLIGGKPAARMGDSTAHGGVITAGCPTVVIGETGGGGASSKMAHNSPSIELDISASTVPSQDVAKKLAEMTSLSKAAEEGKAVCSLPESEKEVDEEDNKEEEKEDCTFSGISIERSLGQYSPATLKWHPAEEFQPYEIISTQDGNKINTIQLTTSGLTVCEKHQNKAVQIISPTFEILAKNDNDTNSIEIPYIYPSILARDSQHYKVVIASCEHGSKEFQLKVFPFYQAGLKLNIEFKINPETFTEINAGVGGELLYKWNNKSGGIKLKVGIQKGKPLKFICTPTGGWNDYEFKLALNFYQNYWSKFEILMKGIYSFINFLSDLIPQPVSGYLEEKFSQKLEISSGIRYEYSQTSDHYNEHMVIDKINHTINGMVLKIDWKADITDKVISLIGLLAGQVIKGFKKLVEWAELGAFKIEAGFDKTRINGKLNFTKFNHPGSNNTIKKETSGSIEGFILLKIEVDAKVKTGIGYKGLKAGAKGSGIKVVSATSEPEFFTIFFTGAKLELMIYSEMPGVDVTQNEESLDIISKKVGRLQKIEFSVSLPLIGEKQLYPRKKIEI